MRPILVIVALVFVVAMTMVASASATACPVSQQHPVVLVPGFMGSVLQGHLTGVPEKYKLPAKCPKKTSEWSTVWLNSTEEGPAHVDCFTKYFALDWDAVTGDHRTRDGVNIRAPDFGGIWAIDRLDPDDIFTNASNAYHGLIEDLRAVGFGVGRTIFGAPFDWRYFPGDERLTWVQDTKELIEKAYTLAGNRKVILVGHSLGGPSTYYMMMSQPLEWRLKYIERWFPVSAVWTGAPLSVYGMLVKAQFGLPWYMSKISTVMRDLASCFFMVPSRFYGPAAIVHTPSHDYTFEDVHEILEKVGITHAKAALKQSRKFLEPFDYEHPGIPVTNVWSTSHKTVSGASYQFDWEVGKLTPLPMLEDGDTMVTTKQLGWLYDRWSSNASTASLTTRVVFGGETNHVPIVAHKPFTKLVVDAACRP